MFCGCKTDERFKRDPFHQLYSYQLKSVSPEGRIVSAVRLYDFSASKMPFSYFMRWLSDVTGFGIVCASGIENKDFSAEIKQGSVDDILDAVSRMLDLNYVRMGNTYFIGKTRKEDRGVYVKRVRYVVINDLKNIISTMLSDHGKCSVSGDGVLVVSDLQSILVRISDTVSRLENSAPGTWIIQFFILNQKREFNLNLGGRVNTSGKIAYELTKGETGSGFDFSDASNLAQNIDLVLQSKSEFVKVVSSPVLLLRDGTSANWQDGLTVPIPQKTVSDSGTVTTNGYTNIDTGLNLTCSLRESLKGAVLTVKYTDSDIKGYNDYQPIISKSELNVNADVESGRIYLLGELFRRNGNRALDQLLDFSNTDNYTRIQLWCRAYQINRCIEAGLYRGGEALKKTGRVILGQGVNSFFRNAFRD